MRVLPILVMAGCVAALAGGHSRTDPAPKPPKNPSPAAAPAKSPASKSAPAANRSQETQAESGRIPSIGSRPDTSFARAREWESDEAEILEYAVKRLGSERESPAHGRLVTERLRLRADGIATRTSPDPSAGPAGADILNAALWEEGGGAVPFSIETICQFSRVGDFRLLRQEQSLQGWPGTTHRSLDCRAQPPRMRVASSGGEATLDTLLTRWPVYTEEMLFTYLRAVPQRTGYREEVWLQDWGREGDFRPLPRYASITVHERATAVRDMDTWFVTVERDDGRRSQFWVEASGLHPIVVADLADGTEWILQGISRRKYRAW